jgi:hypothetical protein
MSSILISPIEYSHLINSNRAFYWWVFWPSGLENLTSATGYISRSKPVSGQIMHMLLSNRNISFGWFSRSIYYMQTNLTNHWLSFSQYECCKLRMRMMRANREVTIERNFMPGCPDHYEYFHLLGEEKPCTLYQKFTDFWLHTYPWYYKFMYNVSLFLVKS